jgi:hypothetical protein
MRLFLKIEIRGRINFVQVMVGSTNWKDVGLGSNYFKAFDVPDRLCGLVVPGCRSRGPGSIPVATRFSEKYWVWNGVHSA